MTGENMVPAAFDPHPQKSFALNERLPGTPNLDLTPLLDRDDTPWLIGVTLVVILVAILAGGTPETSEGETSEHKTPSTLVLFVVLPPARR